MSNHHFRSEKLIYCNHNNLCSQILVSYSPVFSLSLTLHLPSLPVMNTQYPGLIYHSYSCQYCQGCSLYPCGQIVSVPVRLPCVLGIFPTFIKQIESVPDALQERKKGKSTKCLPPKARSKRRDEEILQEEVFQQ